MRNHPLSVGEVVFDLNQGRFGVIVELTGNHAKIDMRGEANQPFITRGWCEYQNRLVMGMDVQEEDLVWEVDGLATLYQVAWGVKDARTENIVCYEHAGLVDEYPYYSPYLEENLYEFEVVFC